MPKEVWYQFLRVQPACVIFRFFVVSIEFIYLSVAGGFFTGRYHSINDATEPGSRFDPNRNQGKVRIFVS